MWRRTDEQTPLKHNHEWRDCGRLTGTKREVRWLIGTGSCFKRLFSAPATQTLTHLCTDQTPWMNSQPVSWLAEETSIEQVFYLLSFRNPATKAAQLCLCHCAFKWKDDLWRGLFIHVHLCWRQAPQSDSSMMLCHFNLHFGCFVWDQSRWQLQGCCSASLSCMWAIGSRETSFNKLRDLKTPVGTVGRSLGSLE